MRWFQRQNLPIVIKNRGTIVNLENLKLEKFAFKIIKHQYTLEILKSEDELSNCDCTEDSESDYDSDYSIEAPPDLDSTRESSNDSFFISNQF